LTSHPPKYKVTYFAEISDRKLENEFVDAYFESTKKFFKIIILALGMLFMLFLIPDFILIHDKTKILNAVAIRSSIFILILFIYYAINTNKSNKMIIAYVTFCEILASIAVTFISFQYEAPNFLIHFFGIILVIIVIFMIPNKLKNMIAVSVVSTLTFLIFARVYYDNILFSEYSAAFVYSVIVIVFCVISKLYIDYSKRKEYLISLELKHISITDYLTSIYNRFKLDEDLISWTNYSIRFDSPFTLVIFDVDNFKGINDKFGHLVGDRILIDLVDLIKNNIRGIDLLYRWGGEEFVILLPNTRGAKAFLLTERLRKLISDHDFKIDMPITCSFGLAEFGEKDDVNSIFDRADKQLYLAKNEGKNVVKREDKMVFES
jgi:diguanylate cyclase (GGDEF)-like protein